MAVKEYTCAYPYCFHHGQKVSASEAVVINKKYYQWDCAATKKEIQQCAQSYVEYTGNKDQYPIVIRIINTMVFKNNVPIDFISKRIDLGKDYYIGKPVYLLYGIRKLYWEHDKKL